METIWSDFVHGYKAKGIICLHDFQTFEDKSTAINMENGVNEKLTKMIMNWYCPGQTLAVEKAEYAGIIQTSLNIPCLCDDAVMELMWGLKNVMHSLVPQEKSVLTKEDRLPMSKGLIMFLRRYGLIVKPDVVNEQIVLAASRLRDCERIEEHESAFLRDAGLHLTDVSGIKYKDWDLLKLSTALKLVCFPEDGIAGDTYEMFSKEELSKLKGDAYKYKRRLSKFACLKCYRTMLHSREVIREKKKELEFLIKEAEEAYEVEQARTTEEDNEAHHEAQQVEAHEVQQADAQQRRRPRKRLKLSKEKRMNLIMFNMRFIKLMKLNKSRRPRV